MGRRKSRAKPAPKKRMEKLDTVFNCPFCNHPTSVECRINLKKFVGVAACMICKVKYITHANALTEPIDIYCEWIDECERLNKREEDGSDA